MGNILANKSHRSDTKENGSADHEECILRPDGNGRRSSFDLVLPVAVLHHTNT